MQLGTRFRNGLIERVIDMSEEIIGWAKNKAGNPFPIKSSLIIRKSDGVNKEVWNKSLVKIEELQRQLPQVSELIKSYNGEGIIIQAEPFNPDGINHEAALADGDMNPRTGIISINTIMRLSEQNSEESIEKACEKSGTFGKLGRSVSSKSSLHTAIHEYAHIIHLALCCKNNSDRTAILVDYSTSDTISDMIAIACHRTKTNLYEFRKSLSAISFRGKNPMSETFSEAISNAILAPDEDNKTASELWKMVVKELG